MLRETQSEPHFTFQPKQSSPIIAHLLWPRKGGSAFDKLMASAFNLTPIAFLLSNSTDIGNYSELPGDGRTFYFVNERLEDEAVSNLSIVNSLVFNFTSEIFGNISQNKTPPYGGLELWQTILIASFLSTLILLMVVGNLFVILAILLERDLQRPQYYLILSLAVADLLVGVLVSPLATVYEVEQQWSLGVQLCDFWISMDVLACTSSILHLVAIALDRYWSITDIMYIQRRTPNRIAAMLLCVWILSVVVSVAPILGWKDSLFNERVRVDKMCLISQDIGYQVFSTAAAFYGPLVIIIILYSQIFKAAKRRIRKTRQKRHSAVSTLGSHGALNAVSKQTNCSTTMLSTCANTSSIRQMSTSTKLLIPQNAQELSAVVQEGTSSGTGSQSQEENSAASSECNGEIQETVFGNTEHLKQKDTETRSPILKLKKRRSRESPEAKRERKAWRTLVIITGSFVACWLPFFILAIVRPMCKCSINPTMESIFLWLGYLNSAINPLIYTIFSPDFRNAFKKILKKLCFFGG